MAGGFAFPRFFADEVWGPSRSRFSLRRDALLLPRTALGVAISFSGAIYYYGILHFAVLPICRFQLIIRTGVARRFDCVILNQMSVLYSNSGGVPLASRLSYCARTKMFALFLNTFQPDQSTTVLDVGVTSDSSFRESNYFEQFYPYPQNITCVGTEDGSHLMKKHPGLRFEQVRPREPLPFRDSQFDIVFSNAVVEHVGCRQQQANFIGELNRVAKAFFITTPSRWFPVEHHTGLPLLHYLPVRLFRSLISDSRYHYWASEEHLNILTAHDLSRILPSAGSVRVEKIRLFGLVSNLVAIGRK